ncbi:MAG: hypothetical protein ACQER9_01535 [Nanobdellota archaeon]
MKKINLLILITIISSVALFTGCTEEIANSLFGSDKDYTEANNINFSTNESIIKSNKTEENLTGDESVNEKKEMDEELSETEYPVITVKEGETIKLGDNLAYDPDGDSLEYEFEEPLNKNGVWETDLGDAGEYLTTVTVSDGKLESSQEIMLVVESVNKKPVISNFKDIEVMEGEVIQLNPKVEDPDGDNVSISYEGFMNSNIYETNYDDAGNYDVTLSATDGKQTTEKTIDIKIVNFNRPPQIENIENIEVTEGDVAEADVEVSDPDGDATSLNYSKPFNESGMWKTSVGDAGNYDVDIIVSDGDKKTEKSFTVKVNALNHAPVLNVTEKIEVNEGETINIDPKISDKDGDSLTVSYTGFMKSSTYETDYDDAGEYLTTVTVSDGKEEVSKDIAIVIKDSNRAPEFNEEAFE